MQLWIWDKSKVVLLEDMIKPFLSHKREDSEEVTKLRDVLKTYGAGGWKDTEDLRVGERAEEGIIRAILDQTGGFIWWGTHRVLASRVVNEIEIPAAFRRKRESNSYPIVPLFIDLNPGDGEENERIREAVGELGNAFIDCNGIVKNPTETLEEFCQRAAVRYVRDSIAKFHPDNEYITIQARTFSEPDGNPELVFDWRGLFDQEKRLLGQEGQCKLTAALRAVRDALQAVCHYPHVLLDQDLPLPIGFMVGYEWRITTRIRLTVRQRTGVTYSDINSDDEVTDAPAPTRQLLRGDGPIVLAVSSGAGFGVMHEQYAEEIGAREIVSLHMRGILNHPEIRGLSRACANELRRVNNLGLEKHLLLQGPASLAILAGAASNASGRVVLPFWDGARYSNQITVG